MALQLAPGVRPRRAAQPSLLLTTHSGRRLRIRHGTPADLPLLDDLAAQLSAETRLLRWFLPLTSEAVGQLWRQMWQSDPAQTIVVAETISRPPRLIAVAQLAGSHARPDSAEIAIVVRDDYQHDGVGSRLAQAIGQIAQARGLRQLTATTLIENQGVVQLLRRLNVGYRTTRQSGATEISIDLR